MQEKLQMQMEIKLKNSPAHTHFCVCVCVCVWQADFQHVGKQFGDMIERWVHLPRIEAALACRILAVSAAAAASSKMFDMIIAEAAAATRTQWRRHILRAWENGKNCWGCKWCHGLTHVICLAIFGEAAGAGARTGRAGQGLGGAHKQDKTFDLLLTWTTGSNNGTRPCYVEGGVGEVGQTGSGTIYANACVQKQTKGEMLQRVGEWGEEEVSMKSVNSGTNTR